MNNKFHLYTLIALFLICCQIQLFAQDQKKKLDPALLRSPDPIEKGQLITKDKSRYASLVKKETINQPQPLDLNYFNEDGQLSIPEMQQIKKLNSPPKAIENK